MIGLSASLCVKDILEGKVNPDQVEKIISGISASDERSIDEIVLTYRRGYWKEDPNRAEKIFRTLLAQGKIVQPRLVNDRHVPLIANGQCWVTSEDQIKWSDEPK